MYKYYITFCFHIQHFFYIHAADILYVIRKRFLWVFTERVPDGSKQRKLLCAGILTKYAFLLHNDCA